MEDNHDFIAADDSSTTDPLELKRAEAKAKRIRSMEAAFANDDVASPQSFSGDLSALASGCRADEAHVTTKPASFTGAQFDRELDLEYALVELNQKRNVDKEAMSALLYELHSLMAGTGRAGKFTPFLRNKLKWPEKYAYDKAKRWIAGHELRAGLIDEETYTKRMGNGSTTLRSDSSASPGRPTAPALHQTFTLDDGEEGVALLPPTFTADEIAADIQELEERKGSFHSSVLMRAYYPVAFAGWFQSAWKSQARRHGTKTFADTLARVMLVGFKPADKDDDWGQCFDEILRNIGLNPASALQPDFVHPEDREGFVAPAPVTSDVEVDPVDTVAPTASGNAGACAAPYLAEQAMDDFDDDMLGQ